MKNNNKQKCIIYIGDFDLRNQNVQAHLVKNNAKIFNRLGYNVAFIGENRESSKEEIATLPKLDVGEGNLFFELENTLTLKGLLKYRKTAKQIMAFMEQVAQIYDVKFVISYQAPTYAIILKRIALWCKQKGVKYIVNSADIPILILQPFFRRIAMTLNWKCLHRVNKKYADGLIAVSRYIESFYHKNGMPTIVLPPLFDDYIDIEYELADKTTFVYAGVPFFYKKNVNTAGMKDRLDKIVDMCLQLSKECIKYRLIIIGITKDLYNTCIPWHKDALDNNRDILFMGRRSHQDTLSAVRNADYMINYRDVNIMNMAGVPTKLVECVSLGTPMVMNSIGDTFLYLQEGITGYELTGDFLKDVAILKSLCDNTSEERLKNKHQCADAKTFALDNYVSKLDNFLSAVLANRQ